MQVEFFVMSLRLVHESRPRRCRKSFQGLDGVDGAISSKSGIRWFSTTVLGPLDPPSGAEWAGVNSDESMAVPDTKSKFNFGTPAEEVELEYRTYTCDIEQARGLRKWRAVHDWMNGNNLQTTAYEELEVPCAGTLVETFTISAGVHDAVFEDKWPIFRLALLVSAQDQGRGLLYDEWESILDGLAEIVRSETSSVRAPNRLLEELNEVLFEDFGLAGNLGDYYNPNNSYLDRVLEKKVGIPLTLSIVYMAVAERAGIPVQGVGIPGRFMVKSRPGRDIFADPFNKGRLMSNRNQRTGHCSRAVRRTRPSHCWTRKILVRFLEPSQYLFGSGPD